MVMPAAMIWASWAIYNTDDRSNMQRMADKGMIPQGSWRVIWKSPLLPPSPWAMSTKLPEQMRKDVQQTLLDMQTKAPEAFKALTDGKAKGFKAVTHKDYEPVVRMISENLKERRGS